MASVKSTLYLQDKMSSTFNSIDKAARNTSTIFDTVSNRADKMSNKLKNASNMTSSFIKGFLGASIIKKVFR